MIQRFIVSRDDNIYQAFPDVALTHSGRLVCVFSECTHHRDRSYTRNMLTTSDDRGRTWTTKRPLTDALRGNPQKDPFWDCPRVVTLGDGRLAALVSRISYGSGEQSVQMLFSSDNGETWSDPVMTPAHGIVPDKLVELRRGPHAGRWILSAHTEGAKGKVWMQRCWLSDDCGGTWRGPITVAAQEGLELCEGSIIELPGGELACFLRENSGRGLGAFKTVSRDGGESWHGLCEFPLPGCHRPVAGMLQSGRVMIAHRFWQGGRGWTQNFFAAVTDVESCLATERKGAYTRIMPLDYDRSPEPDTGYSGWVQFPDGEIYVVNYIMDDALKAHIRGYAFREDNFLLPTDGRR